MEIETKFQTLPTLENVNKIYPQKKIETFKCAMIKLKSLFRRGQGPSGSSKHSANANTQLRAAASTSSLNSIGLSTTSSSTTATTKSSKSALKKGLHTGSNDRFESSTFRESHESLDIKNSSKLYPNNSSGGGSNSTSTTSGCISTANKSTTNNKKRIRTERDQLLLQSSMPMPEHLTSKLNSGCISKLSIEHKDSDNETGVDDGCASCYSNSMRDLLSADDLTDDCTFNGTDEIQVQFYSIFFT